MGDTNLNQTNELQEEQTKIKSKEAKTEGSGNTVEKCREKKQAPAAT